MTSWGRTPTDSQFVVPIARRSARDPVQLQWIPSVTPDGSQRANTAEATFEHRDKRLWRFTIAPLGGEMIELVDADQFRFFVHGCSSGCEPVRFMCRDLPAGKNVVARFANMPLDTYEVLVADADGSTDHPCAGEVVQVEIRRERRRMRSGLPNDYDITFDTEVRAGRLVGPKIHLFPTQVEINAVLDTILPPHTEIVERLIAQDRIRRFAPRQQTGIMAPQQRQTTRTTRVSRRQFGDLAAAVDHECMPDAREARSIQL